MGIFSSKKKTVVGTTVSRVLDDASLPDSVKTGTTAAILRSGDIHEEVLNSLFSGISTRAERMHTYARDKYGPGLPSGEFLSASKGKDEIQAILDTLEGAPVSIEYSNYGPANSLHFGWMQLVSQYGYNPATNELTALSAQQGAPVYLDNMRAVVPAATVGDFSPGSLAQWGPSPTAGFTPERPNAGGSAGLLRAHSPVVISNTAVDDYIQVDYVWRPSNYLNVWEANVPGSTLLRGVLVIPLSEPLVDPEADYFHVRYTVGGQVKFWLYRQGTGTYPALDGLFDVPHQENGDFFPFLYFRFNKQSELDSLSPSELASSKRMAKYIGMDFEAVTEAIHENPDIDAVEQAMVIMAVPPDTTNKLEQRYLFEFFDAVYNSQENQAYVPSMGVANTVFNVPMGLRVSKNAIVIRDRRFKMTLSYSEISRSRVVGTVAAVGGYASGETTVQVQVAYQSRQTNTTEYTSLPVKGRYYRYQKTPQLYEEVVVYGLQMQYEVSEGNLVTADGDADILLIPIDRSITSKYSAAERELLYSRSLHYVFNSLEIVKIRWYQREEFQIFMFFVAVVIAIYDGGATLGAYLGLTGAAAVIATIVVNLVLAEAFKLVFKLFAKAFGEEFAMLVAIVALVASAGSVINAGSLAKAPWAIELLQVANGLTQAAMTEAYSGLAAEAGSFAKYMEEQYKILDTAKDLLESSNHLSPFVIFGESPSDYYNRTVHSGNIGVLGIEAISKYTEIALTLPKLNDTIGDVL